MISGSGSLKKVSSSLWFAFRLKEIGKKRILILSTCKLQPYKVCSLSAIISVLSKTLIPHPKRGLLQEPRQRARVVQVEVRDEEEVDLVGLDHVHVGEGVHAGEARVDAAVKEDALLLELKDVARTTDLK